MHHPTFLARIRRFAPALASGVYALWLGLLCTPIPVGGSCCGGSSSEPDCDQGTCTSDQRNVTITVDQSGISELGGGPRTWSYTITAEGMTTKSGTFSDTSSSALGTFCAPLDKTITVKITQTSGPLPPVPADDPTYGDDPVDSSASNDYQHYYNDPPTDPDDGSSSSSEDSESSGSCLLKLTWCGECSDNGEHCGKLGTSSFTIPRNPCGADAGGSCATNGSVDFRVNLGRGADGRTMQLVIHENTIAACMDPAAVKFPAIVNRYELEIWHWFGYDRHYWILNEFPDPDEPEVGGFSSERSGRRYTYQFVGQQGYKSLFQRLGLSPVKRGTDHYGPQPPSGGNAPDLEVEAEDIIDNPHGANLEAHFWNEPSIYLADQNYADGVKEITWGLLESSPRGLIVPFPAGAVDGANSDESLDDYVRAHFLRGPKFYSKGDLDLVGRVGEFANDIITDEAFAFRINPSDPEVMLTEPAQGSEANPSPFAVAPPPSPLLPSPSLGATYRVRSLALGVPGAVGALPSASGSTTTAGPEVIVKIEPFTPAGSGYAIKAFWWHQAELTSTGVVFTEGPFATWTVTRPQTSQLQIVETRDAQTVVTHLWEENGTTWSLTTTKGHRQEVDLKEAYLGGEKRTITVTDLALSKVVSKVERITNSAGDLASVTAGMPADGQLITTYGYDGTGKRIYFTRNNGNFEIYKTFVDSGNLYGGGTFEATIRPWQDLAFNAGLTISQGAATLTKTVMAGPQEERTTIELVNGAVMSNTYAISTNRTMTAASDPWLAYRLTNGVTLPVRRTTTTRSWPAQPGVTEVTIQDTFTQSAPGSLRGQPAYRKDPDGKVTVYHHYRTGTYSPTTDSVQQGGDGLDRVVWQVTYDGRTTPFGVPLLQSDSARIITDAQGRTLSHTNLTWAAGEYNHLVALSKVRHVYTPDGKRTQTLQYTPPQPTGSIAYSAEYDNLGRLWREFDPSGGYTDFSSHDGLGHPIVATRQAHYADANYGLPQIPERVSITARDAEGNPYLEMYGTWMKESQYDSRGRLTQEVEGVESGGSVTNGRTTNHGETIVGVNTVRTTTFPSGATTVTETYPDGQAKSITGTAQPSELTQRFVNGAGFSAVALPSGLTTGFIVEQTTTGGEVSSIRLVGGDGRTLADYVLSFNASQQLAGSWRTYTYDHAGRVVSEHLAGELVRGVIYGWEGTSVETIHAAPSPNQVRSTVTQYSLESAGWHRLIITSDGTQKQRISNMAPGVSHTVLTDVFNRTTIQTSDPDGFGAVVTNVYGPDANNPSVTVTRGGLVQYRKGSATPPTIYGYDEVGRQVTVAAPGGVNTTITYDAIYGQPETITTTGNTLGVSATVTKSMTYYAPASVSPGQTQTRTVDGRTTNYSYYPDGSLKATWGAEYSQKYEYLNGRVHRLHTYRTAPAGEPTGGGDITEWIYKFGLLWKKVDAASKAVTYTYDTKGRIATRTWARGVSTTYSFDRAGQLTGINYSDATPDVNFGRDALGRLTFAMASTGEYLFDYSYGSQFAKPASEGCEIESFGAYDLFSLNRSRLYGLTNPVIEHRTMGSYSNEGGDVNVATLEVRKYETAGGSLSNANDVTFARNPATGKIDFAAHPQLGGGPILKATYVPDGLGRLKRVETGIQGGATKAFMEYTYVNGQREQAATGRGTWHYGYNGRGEITSGIKKITNTSVPGYSFGYEFDGIGNRQWATTNGVTDPYMTTSTNEYVQRMAPAYFQVRGIAQAIPVTPPGTPLEPEGVVVKLEGAQSPYTAAAFGPANYFGVALPVPLPGSNSNALWTGITVEAWANSATNEYKVTETRKDFLPKSPEDYDYDFDGNLIKDGRWTYQWDAENRLVRMTARTADFPGGNLPAGMEVSRLDFKYDWKGRRTAKQVLGPGGLVVRSNLYFYDDWTLLLEIERDQGGALHGHVITREYFWGPDLSGEVGGAGGAGGLQRVKIVDYDESQSSSTSGIWIPAYDGNGNIVVYLDQATGNIAQEEEYGPFGEALRSRSTSPIRSPFGWSTRYTDEETGLVYYGYRYYAPKMGRWINRDPIEEDGGVNLHGSVGNNPQNFVDILGLSALDISGKNCNTRKYAQQIKVGTPAWFVKAFGRDFQSRINVSYDLKRCEVCCNGKNIEDIALVGELSASAKDTWRKPFWRIFEFQISAELRGGGQVSIETDNCTNGPDKISGKLFVQATAEARLAAFSDRVSASGNFTVKIDGGFKCRNRSCDIVAGITYSAGYSWYVNAGWLGTYSDKDSFDIMLSHTWKNVINY